MVGESSLVCDSPAVGDVAAVLLAPATCTVRHRDQELFGPVAASMRNSCCSKWLLRLGYDAACKAATVAGHSNCSIYRTGSWGSKLASLAEVPFADGMQQTVLLTAVQLS